MPVIHPKPQPSLQSKFSLPSVRKQSEVIWKDKICGSATRLTLLLLTISIGILIVTFSKLPSQVPLFFSQPWGQMQLTHPLSLFILPSITFATLFINASIASFTFSKDKLLARMLLTTTSLVGFLTLFALIKIHLLIL